VLSPGVTCKPYWTTSKSASQNRVEFTKAKLPSTRAVINLTNKEALYNFLSSFSGTHFVTPRVHGAGARRVLMRPSDVVGSPQRGIQRRIGAR
jgi:hypothetical protein